MNTNPLISFLDNLRTEPFEIGSYDGELFPANVGYDKKKTFVYGHGYVTLRKKHLIDPLVIGSDLVKDVISYYEKYSFKVLLYSCNIDSAQLCEGHKVDQLKSLITNPEYWLEYFDSVHTINEKIKEVIAEKWNVVINNDSMFLIEGMEKKGMYTSSYMKALRFRPSTSIMGLVPMAPHIDWISYEKVIDNFILNFTPKGKYETNDDLLKVMDILDNESVSDKLEYITNKEVIRMIDNLNILTTGEKIDPLQLGIEFFKEAGK